MKIKKLTSLTLAFLASLNAFAITPSSSFADSSAVGRSSCCDKETKKEIEELKKKIAENEELKAKIKLFEAKIRELEKNSKSQKTCVTVPTYDKKVKGFLSILHNLKTISIFGAGGIAVGAFFSIISSATFGVGAIATLISGLTVSSIVSWIYYLEGYVSQ